MALIAISHARAEERFVGSENLSGQSEVVDVSHAWQVTEDGLSRLPSYVLRAEVDQTIQLTFLEMLPKLRSLELDERRIDDRALTPLSHMRSLCYTEPWHTDFTKAGMAKLQALRPQLEIKSNPRN